MEFKKMKGFWKSHSAQSKNVGENNGNNKNYSNNNGGNNISNNTVENGGRRLEPLEEIQPEVTAEGYGLRTPYGTHLNLDFVKYCEELMSGQNEQKFQRTSSFRHRSRDATPTSPPAKLAVSPTTGSAVTGLMPGRSNESLESMTSEWQNDGGKSNEHTLMETRRRLEAFRSFRTKKSRPGDALPPQVSAKNGLNLSNGSYNSKRAPGSGTTSGTATPNSHVSSQHLHAVREQMAAALMRLRELEEQVKTIPVLQVHISSLEEENSNLKQELAQSKQRTNTLTLPNGAAGSPNQSRQLLLSGSSGISSCSSQTSLNWQASPSGSPNHDLKSPPLPKSKPPPPPKRKYRTSGAGEAGSIWDVVCYARNQVRDAASDCDLILQAPPCADFACSVRADEVDAAQGVFPAPPVRRECRGVNTDGGERAECACQTCAEGSDFGSQTDAKETRGVGVGDCVFHEMRDTGCLAPSPVETAETDCQTHVLGRNADAQTDSTETRAVGVGDCVFRETREAACTASCHVATRDAVVMTSSSPTADRPTSTHDLVASRDASTDCPPPVRTASASTSTAVRTTTTACGPDSAVGAADAGVNTRDSFVASEREIGYVEPATPTSDCACATDDAGRWCAYRDQSSVACGADVTTRETESQTSARCVHAGTNTPALTRVDACVGPTPHAAEGVDADLERLAEACGASPGAEQTGHRIDAYVDRVEHLLAEQHALLAETYEVSPRVWDRERRDDDGDKVSRFVNPAFRSTTPPADDGDKRTGGDDVGDDKVSRFVNPAFRDDAPTTPSPDGDSSSSAISASFALMSRDQRSAAGGDSSDDDDGSVILPFPTLPSDFELKPILRLPETPTMRKKSVTFAEGVKDEASSDDDDDASSGDSDSAGEGSDDDDDSVIRTNIEMRGVSVKITASRTDVPSLTRPAARDAAPATNKRSDDAAREWSYSDAFVRKPEDVQKASAGAEERTLVAEENDEESAVEKHDKENEADSWQTGTEVNGEAFEKNDTEMGEIVASGEETAQLITEDGVTGAESCNQACGLSNGVELVERYEFSQAMREACDVLEQHLKRPKSVDREKLTRATTKVQQEWFEIAARPDSSRRQLDDFILQLTSTSLALLRKVVNITDLSGNTVLHYALSHGNVLIVETLLGVEELDVDKANQAGYTASMLAALCEINDDAEERVFFDLFTRSDVNAHAKEARQTALMLAVSHGRLHTARLLIRCGADINARDEDGSTALMCAAEHGHVAIVKLLLQQAGCAPALADMDGSTALSIAMDAGHKEIALLLYASVNLKPVTSPVSGTAPC